MPGPSTRDAETMRRAVDHALAYRSAVGTSPIKPRIDPQQAFDRLGGALDEAGCDPVTVIDAMVAGAQGGLLGITAPGFFGYVAGGSMLAGVAADILVSAWGQNAAYAVTTPAVVAMEHAVADWVLSLLGLPATAGVGFVTGATLANTGGIMAARSALLRRAHWDVEADGLFGAPEINVVIGAEAHSSPLAGLRYAGLGAKRVHLVPADDQGRMRARAFETVVAPLKGPLLVILQAGHINSGSYDEFAKIIPMAREKGAWVHVDGAFGLWLRAVPALAGRLNGVELADSWAVDLHKWLNAPYDAGLVIVADREALTRAMCAPAAYLPPQGAQADPNDSVMELSRRARGVPSYAILRTLGRAGVRDMVARHCALAERTAAAVAAVPGATVMNEIACNQVVLRFGEGQNGDAQTSAVLEKVQARGRVYPSHGLWQGRQIIRVSITNCATTEADIDLLVGELTAAWAEVAGQ